GALDLIRASRVENSPDRTIEEDDVTGFENPRARACVWRWSRHAPATDDGPELERTRMQGAATRVRPDGAEFLATTDRGEWSKAGLHACLGSTRPVRSSRQNQSPPLELAASECEGRFGARRGPANPSAALPTRLSF